MKIVIQRVTRSAVRVAGEEIAAIARGLLLLVGAEKGDSDEPVQWLAEKILNLRIFSDGSGKMNLSCRDVAGEILVVSQFTLAGDCTRGRRPGFGQAAPPDKAERLYRLLIQELSASKLRVVAGKFGADMQVLLENDGPVTFILER
ncbi:MAG: D-tyrosyl-tRNA(Tyr) deacylase [Nitrospina sp.]|nr:MAG: D-tyrosyl-tRNA(Tyr) deacylase [Nitrospina sp.]